jgi:N utilization substance protein B
MAGRRSAARRYAVLALYQWQVSGLSPAEIASHFFDDPAWIDAVAEGMVEEADQPKKAGAGAARAYDMQLFDQLLRGVPEQLEAIDAELAPVLDRSIQHIDPVERAILRVGVYELKFSPELPLRVVINEAVDLAKLFGAEQGHRYINGVLDKVARRVRGQEMRGDRPSR